MSEILGKNPNIPSKPIFYKCLKKNLEKNLMLDSFLLEPHFDIDIRYTSTLLPILFHIPGSRASDMVEHPVQKPQALFPL